MDVILSFLYIQSFLPDVYLNNLLKNDSFLCCNAIMFTFIQYSPTTKEGIILYSKLNQNGPQTGSLIATVNFPK